MHFAIVLVLLKYLNMCDGDGTAGRQFVSTEVYSANITVVYLESLVGSGTKL